MSYQQPPKRFWRFGLCQCFNEPMITLAACLCSPCTFLYITHLNMSKVSPSDALLRTLGCCFCAICVAPLNRQKIRETQNIPNTLVDDCCTTFWCLCCSQIQEYQQVHVRPWPEAPYAHQHMS